MNYFLYGILTSSCTIEWLMYTHFTRGSPFSELSAPIFRTVSMLSESATSPEGKDDK